MSKCPYKNFKDKVLSFIEILRKPRKEYGGLPACPFVGSEVDNDKLMIELFDPKKCSILDMIKKFSKSKYESALFVQVSNEQLPSETTKDYQNFINTLMKENGYSNLKCICFNPKDTVNINGFNIRSKAPYFLINIANRSVLHNSQKKLLNTRYFDKMDKGYIDYLKIKQKNIRGKEDEKRRNRNFGKLKT